MKFVLNVIVVEIDRSRNQRFSKTSVRLTMTISYYITFVKTLIII